MRIKKIRKEILVGALVLFLLIGGSYAWFKIQVDGGKQNILRAGTLSLYLDETQTEGINIEGAVPTSDKKGLTQTGYNFKLVNNGKTTVNYTIYLDDASIDSADVRFDDSALKYSLKKNEGTTTTALLSTLKDSSDKRVLESGTIEPGVTNTYSLNLWIKDDATNDDVQETKEDNSVVGKVFAGKLRIEASQIKE